MSLGETVLPGMQGVMGTMERCVSWCFVVVFRDFCMKGNWACGVKLMFQYSSSGTGPKDHQICETDTICQTGV